MHEGQLGAVANSQPRPYFSIHSEVLPEKCLTKHRRSVDCSRTRRPAGFATDVRTYWTCPGPFEGLFLADCNGCDDQSFFY
jgi:hypothetical protein